MTDKWTQTLIPTMRQAPGEAEAVSHKLMLRGGIIRKLSSGSYSYLPLGLRSLHKACAIIREEMNRAGAVELLLPALQPIELWERTGRKESYGENLFTVTDRHGKTQALGPTHEEVITELVGACIESYKDLPKTLYQIQIKFRDEYRPRFGVLRSREFLMKDAYSFHTKLEGEGGLDETYQKQYEAYKRIFERCGLKYEIVEAQSGPIGGSASHEFMIPSPTGEDVILKSDKGNYAANVEKCEIGEREIGGEFKNSNTGKSADIAAPTGELEKVYTPDCATIDDVTGFFKKQLKSKLAPSNMLKTLVGVVQSDNNKQRYVVAVVRGDHDLNEGKINSALKEKLKENCSFEMADKAQAEKDGFAVGFVGPNVINGRDDVLLFIDPDASKQQFWVTGANEKDYHYKHFNWQRDVLEQAKCAIHIADIRNAASGDPSPKNDGGILQETRGIEAGHVFKLGTKYTKALNVNAIDQNNQPLDILMGCYGIGVNRILGAAIEAEDGHDDNGIIWPFGIAPYSVIITPIKYEGEVKQMCDKLGEDLETGGIDVLIDDRDQRPGVKFKDADLIGIPIRITIGDKGLKNGNVEIKARNGSLGERGENVALDSAVNKIKELVQQN